MNWFKLFSSLLQAGCTCAEAYAVVLYAVNHGLASAALITAEPVRLGNVILLIGGLHDC